MRCLATFILVTLFVTGAAQAQTAFYSRGSIYKLDPPASQATGNPILEQVLNSNDMQPVRNLAEDDILRKRAKPVGRLALGLPDGAVSFCTASLIAADLILTNYHCVPGQGNVKEALLWMGYLIPKSRRGVAQYRVKPEPVEADEKLDYAVLRVEGYPGDDWGTVPLSTATPNARRSLFIVHHPGGFAQHITLGRCQASDPAIDGDDLLHVCDTLAGSSGAPMFDIETRKVVGLHYSAVGLNDLNAGKRIASIAKSSSVIARILRLDEQNTTNRSKQTNSSTTTKFSPDPAVAWALINDSTDEEDFEAFLAEFGDRSSFYARLARKAISRIKTQKVATVTTAIVTEPEPSSDATAPDLRSLATSLQRELKRVGCYRGSIDGDWGQVSRSAIKKFNRETGLSLDSASPNSNSLKKVVEQKVNICKSASAITKPVNKKTQEKENHI